MLHVVQFINFYWFFVLIILERSERGSEDESERMKHNETQEKKVRCEIMGTWMRMDSIVLKISSTFIINSWLSVHCLFPSLTAQTIRTNNNLTSKSLIGFLII